VLCGIQKVCVIYRTVYTVGVFNCETDVLIELLIGVIDRRNTLITMCTSLLLT
jgi:hypothetical protein